MTQFAGQKIMKRSAAQRRQVRFSDVSYVRIFLSCINDQQLSDDTVSIIGDSSDKTSTKNFDGPSRENKIVRDIINWYIDCVACNTKRIFSCADVVGVMDGEVNFTGVIDRLSELTEAVQVRGSVTLLSMMVISREHLPHIDAIKAVVKATAESESLPPPATRPPQSLNTKPPVKKTYLRVKVNTTPSQ